VDYHLALVSFSFTLYRLLQIACGIKFTLMTQELQSFWTLFIVLGVRGSVVVKVLWYYKGTKGTTNWKVAGSIPNEVIFKFT
jgi:hypothetical protein